MSRGIIVAGFTAIGKTTLARKYFDIIDLESSLYQWKYSNEMSLAEIESNKGNKARQPNEEFPQNYINAILKAREKYKVVLISTHWEILKYFNENDIDFYLVYPQLDSGDILKSRCIERGNSEEWSEAIKNKVTLWYPKLKEYKFKKILFIDKDEYLEDVLKKEHII